MNNGISETLITAQFFHSMHTCGIRPRESFTPIMDGATRRFSVEGDKSSEKSGAYFIHADDCPTWGVMDYHIHSSMQKFKFDFSGLSSDERREFLKQNNLSNVRGMSGIHTITESQRKKQEKANANKENQQAALRMAINEYLYSDLFGVFMHTYLRSRFTRKGIHIEHSSVFASFDVQSNDEPENYSTTQRMPVAISRGRVQGGLCKNGELIIPMLNIITGEIQSLIHIPTTPNQEGKFLKLNYTGLTIQGAAHWLIPKGAINADCLFVCEGICTALAVLIDTQEKYPIFSAGTCHNLFNVCKALRTKYPDKKIIVIADNDANNAGKIAAEKCKAEGFANGIRMPEITGHDWYDKFITNFKKGI